MNTRLLALLTSLMTLVACGIDHGQVEDGDFDLDSSAEAMDELASARGRFETFTGRDEQTYFHLLAGNGEKVLASEGYRSPSSAAAGIASVKANGVDAANYELREARNGAAYFVLKARNGEIIGVSEMYASRSNAARAIESVVKVVVATTLEVPAPQTEGRFEVFKSRVDGKHYFQLRARNGQLMLLSQAYSARTKALAGVQSVQTNGLVASRFTVLQNEDGRFWFTLRAANGQVIATSQTYASKANAERAVETVMRLVQPVDGAK